MVVMVPFRNSDILTKGPLESLAVNSPKGQKVQVWPGLSSFVAVMGSIHPLW